MTSGAETTIRTAIPSDVLTDEFGGRWVWVRGTHSRGSAKQIAAAEFGCDFVQIRLSRCFMRPFPDADDVAQYAAEDYPLPEQVGEMCHPNHQAAELWWACEVAE